MGLGSVIFPTGTYTVTRTARGGLDHGHYAAGATSTLDVVADVQAISGDDLKDLPEAMRGTETRVMYTATQLIALGPANDGDVVAIDGDNWRVVRVQRYRVFANRWRAYVQRLRTS